MNQPLAENPSFRAGLLVSLIVVGLVAYAQLSGMLLLALTGTADPQTARPLTIYSYWYWYAHDPRLSTYLWGSIAAPGLILLIPAALAFMPRKKSLHGDARWAKRSEIVKAGLLRAEGIIVGKRGDTLLTHAGGGGVSPHVYLAAPTGSGKTQGVILPNALNWPGSFVALDIKGELYERSAGYRASFGHAIHRLDFAPRDGRGAQYNPFAYVSDDPTFRVGDIAKIGAYLIALPTEGDPFWANQGRQLFLGLALYLYGTGETPTETPTLPKMRSLLLVPEGIQAWAKTFIASPERVRYHPECIRALGAFAASAENTATGIRDTVASALLAVVNDVTAAVLSGNSFDLRTLRQTATSIYLVVMPSDREQVAPLVRLFFQQLVDVNSTVEFGKDKAHKHRVLLAMDEFAMIGRVPAISDGIAYIRSYGLVLLAIVQSPAQLNAIYKHDVAKSFTDNFGCTVFYTPGPRDVATAEEISKVIGYETVPGVSHSKRTAWFSNTDHQSMTTSDQKRALMLPQEVLRMSAKEEIIVVAGYSPIRAKKIWADRDKRFNLRRADAPVAPWIGAANPAFAAPAAPITRPVTPEDMPNLAEMRLDDFSIDFSDIDVPGEPASPQEIEELCNRIYERIAPA